jgi:transcriptional regulator with XRE-family HTH domain
MVFTSDIILSNVVTDVNTIFSYVTRRCIVAKLSLTSIGPLVRGKRGVRGIREVAADIGISYATLSRVENGKVPDLETFSKICKWLELDPSEILGCGNKTKPFQSKEGATVLAHFRAEKDLNSETLQALTEIILRARKMIEAGG